MRNIPLDTLKFIFMQLLYSSIMGMAVVGFTVTELIYDHLIKYSYYSLIPNNDPQWKIFSVSVIN